MKKLTLILILLCVFGCANQESDISLSEPIDLYSKTDIKDSSVFNFALNIFEAVTNLDSLRLKELYISQSDFIEWLKDYRPDLKNGSFDYHVEKFPLLLQRSYTKTLSNLKEYDFLKGQSILDSINYRYWDKKKWVDWPDSRNYVDYKDKLGSVFLSYLFQK